MESLLIEGGNALYGEVNIAGAKNSALPILMATLMAESPATISNVPQLEDVRTTHQLLTQLGARLEYIDNEQITSDATQINHCVAPYDLVKTMRASILVLGPLLARFGHAEVSLPGGCAIGARPVNLHIHGLQLMGAKIKVENGYINAKVKGRLKGATIFMDAISVTGTENLMMAATLAEGQTIIENVAREPEIVDVANFLNAMGARISGAGSDKLIIDGVKRLQGCEYRVMPDRIETGTYLVAATATGGKIRCLNTDPFALDAVLSKLRELGRKLPLERTG